MAVDCGLAQLDSQSRDYAATFVDRVLQAAVQAQASDVHFHPVPDQLEVRWRVDGVLHTLGTFSRGAVADVVTRLKVMAQLLTYHAEVPQEGRLHGAPAGVEMRVSTFPTLHGERAAVRIFASPEKLALPHDLGLPSEVLKQVVAPLHQITGGVIISGPAGAGKTTTAYALLRELAQAADGAKSIVALEDPIEGALAGVSQSQVKPAAGFTLASGLRSLLRQDPEVILVGEIRDAETAEAVFQASLTGHLVISTFHAGSAAETIGRLLELGLEPYLLRSGLQAVICQRLLRKLCQCKQPAKLDSDLLGLPLQGTNVFGPGHCAHCCQCGYRGRTVIAECLSRSAGSISSKIVRHADTRQFEIAARAAGMTPLLSRAIELVASGITSPAEVRRVLGFQGDSQLDFRPPIG